MDFKVLHVGISVYNMDESLKWYEKNLGFKLVNDNGFVPPLKARVCFIQKTIFKLNCLNMNSRKSCLRTG